MAQKRQKVLRCLWDQISGNLIGALLPTNRAGTAKCDVAWTMVTLGG